MRKTRIFESDIDSALIHYIDKYLKTVIINAKRHYYKKKLSLQKRGIVFVELEKYEDNLFYEDEKLEEAICLFIEIQNERFPIYNSSLAEALTHLSERQRTVLLENVVLEIPLKQIAHELGISKRMAEKHKHNAIELLKKEMSLNAKKTNNKEKIIIPPADIILDFLNDNPKADVELLKFYDKYIQKTATETVFSDDGTIMSVLNEDLMQEIRVALIRSLPILRKTLKNKYPDILPLIVIIPTGKDYFQ